MPAIWSALLSQRSFLALRPPGPLGIAKVIGPFRTSVLHGSHANRSIICRKLAQIMARPRYPSGIAHRTETTGEQRGQGLRIRGRIIGSEVFISRPCSGSGEIRA